MNPWEVVGKAFIWIGYLFVFYVAGGVDATDGGEPYGAYWSIVLCVCGFILLVLPTVAGFEWPS